MSRPGRLLLIFVLGATILPTLAGEPASRAEAAPQFFRVRRARARMREAGGEHATVFLAASARCVRES